MSRNSFSIGLAAIVVLFLVVARARYNPASFGATHDDSLYFSSAKSLAEGRGYRMASVPGEPPQTKYPALYPALLSLVWTIDPQFPRNLDWAWGLNALFAALGVASAVALARQLGAGRGEALGVAGLTAVHPYFIYWTDQLVSDVLFTALALGAAVLAERELRGQTAWSARWAGVVALLGLACATRTVGAAFVAGVAVTAFFRGARLKAVIALGAATPSAVGLLSAKGLGLDADAAAGFQQNLVYYASYVEHWKQSVPSWDVLSAQVQMALTEAIKHPGIAVFQLPAAGFVSMPMALLAIAASVGVVNGVVQGARQHGLHPVHAAALFYLPIVLLWNYLIMERFWLPFLPLLLTGALHELGRIAGMARESWRKSPRADRAVVAVFGGAVVALVALAAYRGLWRSPRALERMQQARAELTEPKIESYRWLAAHSDPGDAVISNDDAVLYLYSGRQGMRPLALLTDSFFAQDEARLNRDLAGLTDTAAALRARYWVTSPDDFELTHAPRQIRERVEKALSEAPVVFESGDGRVAIHDLSSMPWYRPSEAALRSGDAAEGFK